MKRAKWSTSNAANVPTVLTLIFLCVPVLALPARADDARTKAAMEAVKNATDAQILTELKRRHTTRHTPASKSKSLSVRSREMSVGLAAVEDADLMKALHASNRAVYGVDDRREWHQVTDENIRRLARASVALFYGTDTRISGNNVKLKTNNFGKALQLCPGEPFANQVTGAYCSGTLVRKDVVLTAGHCVREISKNSKLPKIKAVSFVFGYRVDDPASPGTTTLSTDHLYKGKAVIGGELSKRRDWALVRLDRPVSGNIAEPVKSWKKSAVAKGGKVFVIGYPSGLPLKYAPNAIIRDVSNPIYFVANLDTFGGNSGSGVFDEATNELTGVLVRGITDYVKDNSGNCRRVHVCPSTGCEGEEVTRISLVPAP